MSFTTNAYNARKRWYPSSRPESHPHSGRNKIPVAHFSQSLSQGQRFLIVPGGRPVEGAGSGTRSGQMVQLGLVWMWTSWNGHEHGLRINFGHHDPPRAEFASGRPTRRYVVVVWIGQSAIRCVVAHLDRIVFLDHERFHPAGGRVGRFGVRHGEHGVRGNVFSVVAGTVVHAGHSFGNGKAAAVVRWLVCVCADVSWLVNRLRRRPRVLRSVSIPVNFNNFS